jgi:hypothetical protein
MCPYRFAKLLCHRQFNAYAKVASTVLVLVSRDWLLSAKSGAVRLVRA